MNNDVLVFSIALEGYERLFESCIETQRQYCRRCDYTYTLVDEAPRRVRPIEAAWLKVALIAAALKAGHEWVAFIDADCDVRNSMPCFADFLSSLEGDKSLFLAPGFSGRINSGVIFAKNSPSAVKFFESVLSHADQEVPEEDKAPYENGHMIYFGKRSPDVYLLEHDLWNNNSKLDNKSYIQHYSGGILRQWFMKNRAPAEFRSMPKGKLGQVIEKVAQMISWRINSFAEKRSKISASISELTPFYAGKYPEFASVSTKE